MPDPDIKESNSLFTPDNLDHDDMPKAFDLLKPSWQAIKLNSITLIEFIAIPILLALATLVFIPVSRNNFSGVQLLRILPTIVSLILGPGLIYTLIQGAKNKKVDFLPAFTIGLSFFWRFLAVTIVTSLIIVIGFCLLIVPGVYMLRRYYLAPYYLIDRNLGFMETLRVCGDESKQFTGPILGVFGVQLLFGIILIIPVLGWIAGAILSIMYYNAPSIRYLQISQAINKAKPAKA